LRARKGAIRAHRAKRSEALSKLGYLLRLVAKLKMRDIDEWIEEFHTTTNRKLVVFSYIKPLISTLHKRYPASVRIDGTCRGRDRAEAIRQFQTIKRIRDAYCNGKAVATAVTMTAASDGLGTDLPWNPILLMQAEDRMHRIGQKRGVIMTYLLARNTVEEHVLKVLITKMKFIEEIMDGAKGDNSNELEAMSDKLGMSVIKSMLG
jgi:SWI/SNF-related matrix-associated actin-dependent regulator 1 of chromatin subfamily A